LNENAERHHQADRRELVRTVAQTRDAMAAKGLLRHSSVNTTLAHYIKDVPEVTANGMAHIEELFGKLDEKSVQ